MADLRMPAINSVIIAGNLTKDPTYRTTSKGAPVSNFPIACSRRYKDSLGNNREEVCYIGVVAWYKLAESCYEFLTKGSAVMVEGELQSKSLKTETGQTRNIIEIKAKRIQFLSKNIEFQVEEDTENDSYGSNLYSSDYFASPDSLAAQSDDNK